jgi:hypothetical protein
MIDLRRAADRFRTDQPGITTWHSFSAGAHYEAENLSFGPLVGVDEHLVEAGAGFDWHAHRGVHIVSWVLDGTLRHEDSSGEVRLVRPGELFVQSAGTGIRHRETNASAAAPLRFVQTTILGESAPGAGVARLPATVADVVVGVRHGPGPLSEARRLHALVTAGTFTLDDGRIAHAGDALRIDDSERVCVDGSGELLVLAFANAVDPRR